MPSPVQIKNPRTSHYLISVSPQQGFQIIAADWYEILDIEVLSEHFSFVSETRKEDGSTIYDFIQKENLSKFVHISNLYLGKIEVTLSDIVVVLSVVLQSSSESGKNIVTVVNPKKAEIKIQPHQLIEVVLFGESYSTDFWNCSTICGENQIEFEQISYRSIWRNPMYQGFENTDSFPVSVYPRASYSCREHHYWFRCSPNATKAISSIDDGIYFAGKLLFDKQDQFGKPKSFFDSTLDIRINIKSKNRSKVYLPQLIPKNKTKERYRKTSYSPVAKVRKVTLVKKHFSFFEEGCKIFSS